MKPRNTGGGEPQVRPLPDEQVKPEPKRPVCRCEACGVPFGTGPAARDGDDPARCVECAELAALADAGDLVARALLDAPPDDEP